MHKSIKRDCVINLFKKDQIPNFNYINVALTVS